MNILKSRYPELQPLVRSCPHLTAVERDLFRTVYLTHKMTTLQVRQWKELTRRQRTAPMMDTSTFLLQLLIQCQLKNRQHILLTNLNVKNIKFAHEPFQSEVYLEKNPTIGYLCRSSVWAQRRQVLSDDALIYLFSELNLIECLSRKRQLFVQLSGTCETFYGLPYYQTRTEDKRKRVEARRATLFRRKRTIQFHLHATRQGQQAHLTDLQQSMIARHLMYYHVSRHEQFDVHHPIETCSNGEMLVDAMIKSKFSQTFFQHRPKQEVEEIRQHLQPIFDQFRQNHHQFYLRRRSRLPLSYAQHHVPESTATLDQLIPLTTSVEKVQHLLRVWLSRVLPSQLFGCKSNHRLFVRKMCFFLQLPRTQEYSLGDALRSMKTSEFRWTKIEADRSSLLGQLYIYHLIYFLIHYVLTLVRSYFYITEGSSPSHPLILVFYRHKIWHVIQQKSHKDLIEKSCPATVEQQSLLDYEEIRFLWKIRFVPKTSTVRYLACIQESLNGRERINQLKHTNEVLKYLRRHNAQLMGISAFNRPEMHRRWQEYCRTAAKPSEESMVFFLRSDVSNFYDSINLDYLDQAIVKFLDRCEFQYDLYVHTVYKTQYRHGRIMRQKTIYWVGRESERICDILGNDLEHRNNGIFHDMIIHHGPVEHYNKAKLLTYIRAQIFNSHLYTRHYTKSPVKTYRRTIGINHGLPMASMLGQIYLNQVDEDIDFAPLDDEFAVRHEDDLLIISPHRYRLRRIKTHMTNRLNELHRINNPFAVSLKTKTNMRYRNMSKFRPVEYWGSLVNIQSREILVHVNPSHTVETKVCQLTIKLTRETGSSLRHALINALCLRAHSYYFDRLYTSDGTFVRNFYFLSKYFLQRLHAMCFRFAQFYSNTFIRSKSLFLFRTMRSALHLLMKKTFLTDRKSFRLKHRCKYVFFLASIQLARENPHLFAKTIIVRRFAHMIRHLKYLKKNQRCEIKKQLAGATLIS